MPFVVCVYYVKFAYIHSGFIVFVVFFLFRSYRILSFKIIVKVLITFVSMQMAEPQHVYPIRNSLGVCIVFNMETFKNPNIKVRDGTNLDKLKIDKTFTKFGYDVHLKQDPSKTDIEEKMKEGNFASITVEITLYVFVVRAAIRQHRCLSRTLISQVYVK